MCLFYFARSVSALLLIPVVSSGSFPGSSNIVGNLSTVSLSRVSVISSGPVGHASYYVLTGFGCHFKVEGHPFPSGIVASASRAG